MPGSSRVSRAFVSLCSSARFQAFSSASIVLCSAFGWDGGCATKPGAVINNTSSEKKNIISTTPLGKNCARFECYSKTHLKDFAQISDTFRHPLSIQILQQRDRILARHSGQLLELCHIKFRRLHFARRY